MILLALDEQGDFEYMEPNKKEPVFIGGVLFYDGDKEGELERERERITAYYKAVCRKYSTPEVPLSYPMTLHAGKASGAQVRNTKVGVAETIHEFLECGTFDGKPLKSANQELPDRKGTYYPYVYLKSDIEKDAFFGECALFNEKKASNLYYHMVHDVVERLIFQSGIEQKKNVFRLELATRSTPPISRNDADKRNAYIAAKYDLVYKDNEGEDLRLEDGTKAFRVQLTDQNVYRTTLSELVIANQVKDPDIDIKVKSINYRNEKVAKNQEFLYLADSICAIFGFRRTGNNAEQWLEQMDRVANDIAAEGKYFLYGYDIVDDDYKRAYAAIVKENYYEALVEIFKFKEREGEFAKYYQKKWTPYLLKMIQKKLTVTSFEKAVSDFARTLKTNTYSQNVGLFVVEELIKFVEKMKEEQNTKEYGKTFFMLYSSAVSAYSHSGKPDKAKDAYHKALRYSMYAPMEEFLALRNKMVVFLTDCFETKTAIKIAEENLIYQTKMGELRESIVELYPAENYLERGKAYSQLGQAYAFEKDDRAIDCFNEALLSTSKDSANYYITESYLLHYYLEKEMEKEYERRAKEYFGGNSLPEKQLEYVLEEANKKDPLINYKFALYVFVKGLWVFHKDDITESLWKKIENIPETLKEHNIGKYGGHPTQLIAKYMQLLLIYHKKEKEHEVYRQCIEDPAYAGDDTLLHCIAQFIQIEIAMYEGKKDELYTPMKELAKNMHERFGVFTQQQLEADQETLWNLLSEKITYMYH